MRVRVFVFEKLNPVWFDPVPVADNFRRDTVSLQDGSVRNAQLSHPFLLGLKSQDQVRVVVLL